jgi:integrase
METEAVRSHLIALRRTAAQGPKRGRGKAKALAPRDLRRMIGTEATCAISLETTGKGPRQAAAASLLRETRDRALLLLGFCAALRRSELVALDVEDVTQDGARGLLVSIRRSKTDQEGEGATVAIPYGGLGTDTAEALETWRALSGITSGPLFRSVDRHGNLGDRITPETANRIVKDRAKSAGVDATGLSAHSLRAGYVTAQALRNTPEHRIQAVTRHRSAEVLRDYIREATVMDRARCSTVSVNTRTTSDGRQTSWFGGNPDTVIRLRPARTLGMPVSVNSRSAQAMSSGPSDQSISPNVGSLVAHSIMRDE